MDIDLSSRTLGDRIKIQRRLACLTQKELGTKLSVTQGAIARWELNQTVPALRHRKRLAAVLKVDRELLFQDAA